MKSRVVKEIMYKYNVRKINGKNVKSYNFQTLCYYLSVLEQGGEVK